MLSLVALAEGTCGSVAATGTRSVTLSRNSTSKEGKKLPPRWLVRRTTRNVRPYSGWRGSQTLISSGKDSSALLDGVFLNPFVCGSRLAQSEGAGNPPAGCGRVNQPLGFACFYWGFVVALAHANRTRHRPFHNPFRATRGGSGINGNCGGADGNHSAARASDR